MEMLAFEKLWDVAHLIHLEQYRPHPAVSSLTHSLLYITQWLFVTTQCEELTLTHSSTTRCGWIAFHRRLSANRDSCWRMNTGTSATSVECQTTGILSNHSDLKHNETREKGPSKLITDMRRAVHLSASRGGFGSSTEVACKYLFWVFNFCSYDRFELQIESE